MIIPWAISSPASVTTNDGTPRKAMIEPCAAPIAAQIPTASPIATRPG